MSQKLLYILLFLAVGSYAEAEVKTTQPASPDTLEEGMIVSLVSGGEVPQVRRANDRNDKCVFGAFILSPTTMRLSRLDSSKAIWQVGVSDFISVLVTDTGGNIEIGDFISPSAKLGLGERQTVGNFGVTADDVFRNFTIGKAVERVDWSVIQADRTGVKKKLILCVR